MYTDLIDNLEILKLDNIKNILPRYLDEMKDKNISFTEMLYDLTREEIKYQTERAAKVNIKVSAFPFEKTLDDFDFSYQPNIDRAELYDLETLRFMEKKYIFLLTFTFNLIPVTIVITKKYIIICLKLNEGGPDSSVTIFFSNVMNNSRENKALSPTIKNES